MTPEDNDRGRIRDYKDLDVWQRAISLCKPIYSLTASFPNDERFGLTSQIRRATVSVSANIAEGWGRGTRQDYCRFVRIARGSAAEVESELMAARELGFVKPEQLSGVLDEITAIRRMLQAPVNSLDNA